MNFRFRAARPGSPAGMKPRSVRRSCRHPCTPCSDFETDRVGARPPPKQRNVRFAAKDFLPSSRIRSPARFPFRNRSEGPNQAPSASAAPHPSDCAAEPSDKSPSERLASANAVFGAKQRVAIARFPTVAFPASAEPELPFGSAPGLSKRFFFGKGGGGNFPASPISERVPSLHPVGRQHSERYFPASPQSERYSVQRSTYRAGPAAGRDGVHRTVRSRRPPQRTFAPPAAPHGTEPTATAAAAPPNIRTRTCEASRKVLFIARRKTAAIRCGKSAAAPPTAPYEKSPRPAESPVAGIRSSVPDRPPDARQNETGLPPHTRRAPSAPAGKFRTPPSARSAPPPQP